MVEFFPPAPRPSREAGNAEDAVRPAAADAAANADDGFVAIGACAGTGICRHLGRRRRPAASPLPPSLSPSSPSLPTDDGFPYLSPKGVVM